MSTPALDDYFACDHPCGRARIRYRHCLAQQGAEIVVRYGVQSGRKGAGAHRVSVHLQPYCATECARGKEIRAMFGPAPERADPRRKPWTEAESARAVATDAKHLCDLRMLSDEDLRACAVELDQRQRGVA
jgi:hypothetical protein